MSHHLQSVNMTDNTYIAWALYTGPAKAKALWDKIPEKRDQSSWISGEWTGINVGITESQIKKDIDARIQYIVNAFDLSRRNLSDKQKETATHYFVIPEFYFHCLQGPYPDIQIIDNERLYPYEYIRAKLRSELGKIKLLPDEVWILGAGSIMTCSEPDFNHLFNSNAVKERLNELNAQLRKIPFPVPSGDQSANAFHGAYIRAYSHMEPERKLLLAGPPTTPEQAIDALMVQFRAAPLCVVRNRGIIFTLTAQGIESFGYEKQNQSTVDLTMGKLKIEGAVHQLELGGMVTEWMAGYPSISIIKGDKQCGATPDAARLTITEPLISLSPLEMGVEICLDHRLQRLRRTVGMTVENGAATDNPPLNIQLVPSGGMQILNYSVSAGVNGVMFNSDGCDPILDKYTKDGVPIIPGSGEFKQIACDVYASSAQTLISKDTYKYYSHSQLSFRYGGTEMTGYDNALGTKNINGSTFDSVKKDNPALDAYLPAKRITVSEQENPLFAGKLGEIHLYLKKQ